MQAWFELDGMYIHKYTTPTYEVHFNYYYFLYYVLLNRCAT